MKSSSTRLAAGSVVAFSLALLTLAALGSVHGWDWEKARCGRLPTESYPELGWIAFVGIPAFVGLLAGAIGLGLELWPRSAGTWPPKAALIFAAIFCGIAAYWAAETFSGCPAIT